ncbi:hypothetical protein [Actinomyces faecalis]|uniref:hypothetical protein n=1 Tax=Actinomyces faecalis TaxID=2722820 RepID=UPI0015517ADB|nr:hypothetical protein [Actinomyces faecalis]
MSAPLTRPARAPRRRLRTATARMKTSTLVDMLEMRGWGALNDVGRKGTRATLRALVLSLPFGSGEGYATVPQIAYKAGYSSRHWVGEMLADLEGLGLVTWRRGGVYHGEPVPSYFRINKQLLADLVNSAREQCAEELAAMRVKMRAHLAKWRHLRYIAPKTRKPRPDISQAPQGQTASSQSTVTGHPTPQGGEAPVSGGPHTLTTPSDKRSASRAHCPDEPARGRDGTPAHPISLMRKVAAMAGPRRRVTPAARAALPWQDPRPMPDPSPAVLAARAAAADAAAAGARRKMS